MVLPRLVLVALSAVLTTSALAGPSWQHYVNDRFGVSADVPQGWVAGEPPTNNDGLRWTAPDGSAELSISGSFQTFDTLDEAFKVEGGLDAGALVTYRAQTKHGITVSGVLGDKIIYQRSLLSCKDTVWNTVYITYPKAQKAAFDPIVAHIAASLKPGKGYNNDDCK